ncbi:phage head spike fiber domain-containing protein [Pseudoduganella armeniaca]|uniref:phage head spike fiber domain-containing protein n=1 Tax=Pseudoduganella armeniaca TaxID=2072590 RepID=UPI001C625426|nr:hypothetical protein [Pseudoduganella armeniaca]
MPSITIPSQGDLFVYESAEASPRANLLGYSEQFDAAAWQKTNVTAAANVGAAPDGTAFADKITGTAAAWWMRQSAIPVESGQEYTASVWMRTTTPGTVDLYMVDTVVSKLACDVTTDWRRFSITYRASSANLAFQIGASAFGRDIFVFGAMVEKGPNMGPYIPSAGAGVAYGPGEGRIRVKPDTGGEIVLRPGQRYRTPERTTNWTIRPYGAEPLEGWLIIGQGDFDDANTKNSVKLDATFANVVTVANDTNSRVPITVMNDTSARVPVSLDPNQLIQQSAPIMAYTNAKSNINMPVNGTWIAVLTAAENVNGVILEQVMATQTYVLCAKASMPQGYYDGDVLSSNAPLMDTTRRKVPAGKGVWMQSANGTTGTVNVLYTVL